MPSCVCAKGRREFGRPRFCGLCLRLWCAATTSAHCKWRLGGSIEFVCWHLIPSECMQPSTQASAAGSHPLLANRIPERGATMRCVRGCVRFPKVAFSSCVEWIGLDCLHATTTTTTTILPSFSPCPHQSQTNPSPARRRIHPSTHQPPKPPHPLPQTKTSNDEGTTGTGTGTGGGSSSQSSPEATPEVWDRMRALLRALPPGDSLSRSGNALEKEAQVGLWLCGRGCVGVGE